MIQKETVFVKKVNKPKMYREEIRHTAECAFQRAIIHGKQSILDGQTVTWLDIELPIDLSGHSRGRCIDLIGIDEEKNYVICELKFRKNFRDNGNPLGNMFQKDILVLLSQQTKHIGRSIQEYAGKDKLMTQREQSVILQIQKKIPLLNKNQRIKHILHKCLTQGRNGQESFETVNY